MQDNTDKFFQRLFNTAKADKCQDALGKSLLKIAVPEILKSSGQLRRECQDVEEQIEALDATMAPLPTLDMFMRLQAQDQEILQAWSERERAVAALQQIEPTLLLHQQQINDAHALCVQYEKDVEAFTAALAGKDDAHRAAKIALGHWENYKNILSVRARLQSQREEINAERAANPEPPVPGAPSAEQWRADIEARQRQIQEAARFVSMFTADGVAECPTCHTPSSQLAAQVSAQQLEIARLEALLADLKQAEATQRLAETTRARWEVVNERLTAREQQLTTAEHELTAVKPPEAPENELQQAVADYEDFAAAQNELQPLLQAARDDVARHRGTLAAQQEHKARLVEQIRASLVTEADADLARRRIVLLQEQCAKRQKLEQQRTVLAADLAQLQREFTAAQQQERAAIRLRSWVAVAERAREALKNAPRLVAQRNLQRLETAINELLQIFGVNFLVRVGDDGAPTFIAEFYDGRRQVAQRLSIGQKTVLALAFRVAVNAQFAEEIGLLALDEPTASLDAPRIRALAPVLEKLRDLSTAKGLQCLLVTHATTLSHLFESTIELEPPELRNVRSAG